MPHLHLGLTAVKCETLELVSIPTCLIVWNLFRSRTLESFYISCIYFEHVSCGFGTFKKKNVYTLLCCVYCKVSNGARLQNPPIFLEDKIEGNLIMLLCGRLRLHMTNLLYLYPFHSSNVSSSPTTDFDGSSRRPT